MQFCPSDKLSYTALLSITNGIDDSTIPLYGSGALGVSAGFGTTFVIDTHGNLWARGGANTYGELGDGGNNRYYHPSFIYIGSNFATVSAGKNHTLAIKTDGSLWAWGSNSEGQVGIKHDSGNGAKFTAPIQIGDKTEWVAVSAGEEHSLALNIHGELFAWGSNRFGQIGVNSSTELYNEPIKVGDGFKSISAGSQHSVSIKSDGSLWAWGYNFYGQLGYTTPTKANSLVPVRIGNNNNWKNISAGLRHTLAITAENKLWIWGNNDSSQLLKPGNYTHNTLQQNIFTEASGGSWFSLVITNDGKLMGAGDNIGCASGNISSLQQIAENFKFVESGWGHAILVKSDGTLWGLGSNGEDEFVFNDDGRKGCYRTPVQIVIPSI